MKKRITVICMISVFALAMIAFAGPKNPQGRAMDHSKWVARSLDNIQTIKVGMTRRDLLKLLTVEGGVSTRNSRTFVFRECPYIKVDVEFEAVGSPEDRLHERMEDKIVRISKPYLDKPVID